MKLRCSSFSRDWLAIAVYCHLILPWARHSEKLLSRRGGHKRASRALELLTQVSTNLEVVTQSRLWCKHLGEGATVKLMALCCEKNPSISQVKTRLSDHGWHETRVDDLKPYAAFPGGSQVILGRDGDGYFVFGDGPSQVVDAKQKTRYTYEASDHGDCKRDSVSVHSDGDEMHLNSSTNMRSPHAPGESEDE